MPVAPIIRRPIPMCAISCEIFLSGTFFKVSFGLSETKFVSSYKELVIIHEEKMKKKLLIKLAHQNLSTKRIMQQ